MSAAILAGPDAGAAEVDRLFDRLGRLFAEVLVVGASKGAPAARRIPVPGGAFPVAHWSAALGAAGSERVLVVSAGDDAPSEALLLALVAWPESDAVLPRDATGPRPLCALYRRGLAEAHPRAASLDAVIGACDASFLETADLARIDS